MNKILKAKLTLGALGGAYGALRKVQRKKERKWWKRTKARVVLFINR